MKAVLEKKVALEMGFQFITKFNRALRLEHRRGKDNGDRRDWFSLSRSEKRHVKEGYNLDSCVIDLGRLFYDALKTITEMGMAGMGTTMWLAFLLTAKTTSRARLTAAVKPLNTRY